MADTPSIAYSVTIRVAHPNDPRMLGRIATVIAEEGGDVTAVDIVSSDRTRVVRTVTVNTADERHARRIARALRRTPDVRVVKLTDRVFDVHDRGKIEVRGKAQVRSTDDLSMVYTPGVGRVSMAIHADPDLAWTSTIRGNTVAVVTDGTAVLDLGDIGPLAALPVMEGKAMLFKQFAGVDAWPICLDTKDPDEIVETVKRLAPGFGGVNLEDISAPRCFAIEERLKEELDIPIMHDDQHGTAVVVLAALLNALRLTGKRMDRMKIVVAGTGAGGAACIRIMPADGARNIVALTARARSRGTASTPATT